MVLRPIQLMRVKLMAKKGEGVLDKKFLGHPLSSIIICLSYISYLPEMIRLFPFIM